MKLVVALFCMCLFIGHSTGRALADDVTCAGLKHALVTSNLAFMRIERGPLPVAPVQAGLVIGQMTALMNLGRWACSEVDAEKIVVVVKPRRDALQLLLPTVPADAGRTTSPPAIAASSAPGPTPPSDTRKQTVRKSVSAATCHRTYYMKGGHRYWHCK